MRPRIGELFAGYGGLGMGVQAIMGGDVVWYSEIDKGPLKILEHRFPGVPNVGDITAVDWSTVEPVDILTGGSPCQDLSHAGKRAGMTEGTRSNLWVAMREAIAQLKPSLVVWENVEGAASAAADSEVEPCAGCVGDGPGVHLRALGRVVGDLSSLGYVGRVGSLRAADVGAPHGRRRRFLAAYPAGDPWRFEHGDGRSAGHAASFRRHGREAQLTGTLVEPAGNRARGLLPSPRTSDTNGAGAHGDGGLDLRTAVAMLPTPRATDGSKGGPNQRGSSGDLMLPSAVTLLPTPTSMDSASSGGGYNGQTNVTLTDATARQPEHWGQYATAIHRWEQLARPAPAPTELGPKGSPRLSPQFSEWMMGLPAGWVTDVPGITRNEALKALGNGVVPQQAAAALRWCLTHLESEATA